MRSGASPTRDQKTSSASLRAAHRRVAHLGTEQHRTRFEAGEPVARTAQLPRHHERVVPTPVPEDSKVRVAEDLRAGLEADSVRGHRDPGALLAVVDHAVVVHPNLAAVVVDMHVGRRDVGMEMVLLDRPRRFAALPLADCRGVRTLGGEVRILEREGPRRVHAPRPGERVREGEPDVRTLVIGKVEVIAAERLLDPVGDPNERGAVDVRAHPIVHVGSDDRLVGESCNLHHGHVTAFGFGAGTGGDPAPIDPADQSCVSGALVRWTAPWRSVRRSAAASRRADTSDASARSGAPVLLLSTWSLPHAAVARFRSASRLEPVADQGVKLGVLHRDRSRIRRCDPVLPEGQSRAPVTPIPWSQRRYRTDSLSARTCSSRLTSSGMSTGRWPFTIGWS